MGGIINRLLSKWKVSREELAGMGLAFPGMVNPKEKRVTSTNDKYDDACDIDLPSWVDRNWGTSFIIDNDARLALAGEWYMGAGKNSRNMVMMTIGTGIGTGVVLDGRIIKGTHYQAGSLGGHIVVDYRGRRCTCGNIGCVEAMASSFFSRFSVFLSSCSSFCWIRRSWRDSSFLLSLVSLSSSARNL